QISQWIEQAVDVIDAKAGCAALGPETDHGFVGGIEDGRILRPHANQIGDGKKAAIVDRVAGRLPVRQAIMLKRKQPLEIIVIGDIQVGPLSKSSLRASNAAISGDEAASSFRRSRNRSNFVRLSAIACAPKFVSAATACAAARIPPHSWAADESGSMGSLPSPLPRISAYEAGARGKI